MSMLDVFTGDLSWKTTFHMGVQSLAVAFVQRCLQGLLGIQQPEGFLFEVCTVFASLALLQITCLVGRREMRLEIRRLSRDADNLRRARARATEARRAQRAGLRRGVRPARCNTAETHSHEARPFGARCNTAGCNYFATAATAHMCSSCFAAAGGTTPAAGGFGAAGARSKNHSLCRRV